MPKVNLDAQATQPKPVDNGVYNYRLTGHKFVAQSAASGLPYVSFEFTGVEADVKGKKVWGIGSLSEDGIWKFKAICVACGIEEFPQDFDTDSQEDVDKLIRPNYGAFVTLAIGQEEVKDRTGKPQGYYRNVIEKYGVEELTTTASKSPF